jgi:hypothetical protein
VAQHYHPTEDVVRVTAGRKSQPGFPAIQDPHGLNQVPRISFQGHMERSSFSWLLNANSGWLETEKTFSWLSPSEQKKKPQSEDKILGKAPEAIKRVCINFLCGTLQIKDVKGRNVLCANSPCQYEHINLKSMKMASAMTRIRALPQGGRKSSIVAAAKVYPSYKT